MKWLRKLPVGRRRRFSFKSEQIISMNLFFFFRIGRLLLCCCCRGCSSFVIVDGVMCVTLYLRLIRAPGRGCRLFAGGMRREYIHTHMYVDMAVADQLNSSQGKWNRCYPVRGSSVELDLYAYRCVPLSCGYLGENNKKLGNIMSARGLIAF